MSVFKKVNLIFNYLWFRYLITSLNPNSLTHILSTSQLDLALEVSIVMAYLDINLDSCRAFMRSFFACSSRLCLKWSSRRKSVILKLVGSGFFKLSKNDFDAAIFSTHKIMTLSWINKSSHIIFSIVFTVKKKYARFGCFNKDNHPFSFKVNTIFSLNIISVASIYHPFSFCVFLHGLNTERDNCQ